jgi:enolase
MTKKDFELIAGVISQISADFSNGGERYLGKGVEKAVSLSLVAGELASALAGTNERFDREIFLTACGVK